MDKKDNSSLGKYIGGLLATVFFSYIYIYQPIQKERLEAATKATEEEHARREASQKEEYARFEKEAEKTSIKASFISYKYDEKNLSYDGQSSGSYLNSELYKIKCINIFCQLKNPEQGKTITKVAISVFFRAKGYDSSDFTAPNEQFSTEIEVNIPPNTISTLTFTVPQPKDINMVFQRVKLERVIESDGTVKNWVDYWL